MRQTVTYLTLKLKELYSVIALRELLTKACLPGSWNNSMQYERHHPYMTYISIDALMVSYSEHVPMSVVLRQSEKGIH